MAQACVFRTSSLRAFCVLHAYHHNTTFSGPAHLVKFIFITGMVSEVGISFLFSISMLLHLLCPFLIHAHNATLRSLISAHFSTLQPFTRWYYVIHSSGAWSTRTAKKTPEYIRAGVSYPLRIPIEIRKASRESFEKQTLFLRFPPFLILFASL